ncbi:MAG: flippase-like domain-containing protein [Solirubrobacteraceae bacterium]|nr:flippase-like domain-containing protein [Solirubrobacteraceae bacterium]
MSAGRAWVRPLGWVLSAVSLAAVVWWALQQDAPTLPDTPQTIAAFAGAIGLYALAGVVRGERWRLLLVECGTAPRRADCHALVWVGYMGNNVLPARAGDAMRAVFMAPRAQADTRVVIGTLLAERLLDVAVLAAGFVLLAWLAVGGRGFPEMSTVAIVLGVVAVLAAVGALAVALLHRRGLLHRLRELLGPMAQSTKLLRGRHGAEMLVATVVVWALELGVWWLCAEAAGLGIDPIEAGYILALSSMMAMIPAAPGQAGTMDAAVIVGARALGRPKDASVAYLLLLRFVLLVPVTLFGFVLLVTRYGGVARLRAARHVGSSA